MRDIDDRLRELGEQMRAWDLRGSGLLPSTLRKIQRRRRTSVAGGVTVIATLGVASAIGIASLAPGNASISPATEGSSLSAEGSSPPETQEPDESPDPSSRQTLERDDFYGAVWPEDSRTETADACSVAASDSFRSDALRTALEFGRIVLGWDEGEGAVRAQYGNSVQIVLNRDGSAQGAPEGAAVELSLVEYVEDCWSVQAVHPDELAEEGPARMPVMSKREVTGEGNDQANVISIGFDPPPGSNGRIELEYGDYRESRRFRADDVSMSAPLVFNLGPLDPYDAGHAMILFEDEQGRVKTAVAVALLPQKGLARSDGLP